MRGFQNGVVEVISDGRPKYFAPKGYDRFRLIWAFRNFRRLPEPVLSPAQRKAVDRLCRTSEVIPAPTMVIIGAVERVSAAYHKAPQSRRSAEPLAVTAQKVVAHRAAAGASSATSVVPRNLPAERDPERATPAPVPRLQPVAREVAPDVSASVNNHARRSNWVLSVCATWLPLAAVLILGLASFFRVETPPDSGAATIVPPPAAVPAVSDATSAHANQKQAQPLTAPLVGQIAALKVAPSAAVNSGTARQQVVVPIARHEASKPAVDAIPQPPSLTRETTPDGCLNSQSAYRPSRLLYPDTPAAARLPGKVLLKATVGPEGTVESVSTLSGDPVIAAAAASAMRRWHYGHPGSQFETEVMFNFVAPDVTTIQFLGDKQLP